MAEAAKVAESYAKYAGEQARGTCTFRLLTWRSIVKGKRYDVGTWGTSDRLDQDTTDENHESVTVTRVASACPFLYEVDVELGNSQNMKLIFFIIVREL